MAINHSKIRLLARLARLREVEQRKAAKHVSTVETTQRQLQSLSARTGEIAASYQKRRDAMTGAELQAQRSFLGGLSRICAETEEQHGEIDQHRSEAQRQFQAARQKYELTADNLATEKHRLAEEQQASEAAFQTRLARKL